MSLQNISKVPKRHQNWKLEDGAKNCDNNGTTDLPTHTTIPFSGCFQQFKTHFPWWLLVWVASRVCGNKIWEHLSRQKSPCQSHSETGINSQHIALSCLWSSIVEVKLSSENETISAPVSQIAPAWNWTPFPLFVTRQAALENKLV